MAMMFLVLVGAFFILPRDGSLARILVNMAYILSFGLSFGVQFWMTFVNGNPQYTLHTGTVIIYFVN